MSINYVHFGQGRWTCWYAVGKVLENVKYYCLSHFLDKTAKSVAWAIVWINAGLMSRDYLFERDRTMMRRGRGDMNALPGRMDR